MSENIKISVIIPVYNVEKYLKECVDSVLNQTYKNLEVILVDDGSADKSPIICDEYSKIDNRIRVIHKNNEGAAVARNYGMNLISGDYFIFLDSDDYWYYENFIEDIVKILVENQTDILVFGYTKDKKVFVDNVRNISLENDIAKLDKDLALRELLLMNKMTSSPCNKVINFKMIKNYDLDFIPEINSEDVDWVARLIMYSKSIAYYDKYIYFYRDNDHSITHRIKRKNIIDLKNQIIRIVELSKQIEQEDYYEWYMNYCAYQYITFLNCAVTIDKSENISEFVDEMKEYAYLLNYHINKKVNLVYKFYKLLGYKGMLKILKLFLKIRG